MRLKWRQGVRNKFLGTGEPGYHPLRKLCTIFAGLRYAVVYDFSVAWKLLISLGGACWSPIRPRLG